MLRYRIALRLVRRIPDGQSGQVDAEVMVLAPDQGRSEWWAQFIDVTRFESAASRAGGSVLMGRRWIVFARTGVHLGSRTRRCGFFQGSRRGPNVGSTCLVSARFAAPGRHRSRQPRWRSRTTDAPNFRNLGPTPGAARTGMGKAFLLNEFSGATRCLVVERQPCRHSHPTHGRTVHDPADAGTAAVDENPWFEWSGVGEISLPSLERGAAEASPPCSCRPDFHNRPRTAGFGRGHCFRGGSRSSSIEPEIDHPAL